MQAEGWRGGPQPKLSRLLKGCWVEDLASTRARAVDALAARAGHDDIAGVSVVEDALCRDHTVVTSSSGHSARSPPRLAPTSRPTASDGSGDGDCRTGLGVAYAANPARFHKRPPTATPAPAAAWINEPTIPTKAGEMPATSPRQVLGGGSQGGSPARSAGWGWRPEPASPPLSTRCSTPAPMWPTALGAEDGDVLFTKSKEASCRRACGLSTWRSSEC